jgi:AraC-like DNA-binding protein
MKVESDALRRLFRYIPKHAMLRVVECRYLKDACGHGSRTIHEGYFTLLFFDQHRPMLRINCQELGPSVHPSIVLMSPGSTWEQLTGPSGDMQTIWLSRAEARWHPEEQPPEAPADVPPLYLLDDTGPMAWYQQQISFLYHEHSDARGAFRSGYCSALFQTIVSQMILNQSELPRPSYVSDPVLRVCDTMRAYPSRRFSSAELAKIAGLSPRRLAERFRTELGTSPKQYEVTERMAFAHDLLVHHGRRISEVADACGYCDPFLFSRQFKRVFGVAPRDARNSASEGSPSPS